MWNALSMCAELTGESRAALVRRGIQRVTGEILLEQTNSRTANPAALKKSDGPDHASE
jgi:hypothetical protein